MNYYEKQKLIAITILCESFKITKEKMFSKSRKREYTDARFLLCLWIKQNTTMSLKEIGREVRDVPYDHTSAMHAIGEAKNLIKQNTMHYNVYSALPKIDRVKMSDRKDYLYSLQLVLDAFTHLLNNKYMKDLLKEYKGDLSNYDCIKGELDNVIEEMDDINRLKLRSDVANEILEHIKEIRMILFSIND